LAWGAHAAAQQYTVTDLGTLTGNTVSTAYALNDAGEAAGTSSTPTGAIATIFVGGKATNINTAGADVSLATAISGLGEIAGYNIFSSHPTFNPQAFVYSHGAMKNINAACFLPALKPGE
jgi:uncharacterized membrane protein